ncbi:MAG: hypothetical protein QM731_05890 [Chitinophagaceae bacterium]
MKNKIVYVVLLLLCSFEPGKANRCGNRAVPVVDRPCKETAVPAQQHGFTVAGSEEAIFSPMMHVLNNI